MKRFIIIIIPVLAIALFIAVMMSDNYLKYSFREDDNVVGYIQIIINDVNNNQWKAADDNLEKLSSAWKKVIKRIQFSAEKDEINAFDVSIARLKGSIMAKEKANALIELNEAFEHWENVGR